MYKIQSHLLLVSLLTLGSVSAQTIDETIAPGSAGELSVQNAVGSVVVTGWDRDEVHVVGTLGDAERIDVEERRGGVVVEVVYPRSRGNLEGAEIEVSAPRDTQLEAEVVSASLEVSGIEGAQAISTVSGDAVVQQLAARVEIGSVSGDVSVEGRNAVSWTTVSSVSGDIDLMGLSGEFRVHSVSGDVVVDGARLGRGNFETTSGDITIVIGLGPGSSSVEAASVSGDIDLRFANAEARYDLSTLSGDIDNCFGPVVERVSRFGPGRQLVFLQGESEARVSVTTVSGDIGLCRD